MLSIMKPYQYIKFTSAVNSRAVSVASKLKTSTVDSEDIKKHSQLADDWWSDMGMKGLYAMNQLRVPLVRDGLIKSGERTPKPLAGFQLLEVGCGGGYLTEALARLGACMTAIDASDSLIQIAKQHAQKDPSIAGSITYINSTIETHSEQHKEVYDGVVASEVIEHVSEKDLFLKSCISSLKPGGSIFITTLNKTFLSWLLGIVMAEYVLNIVPRGIHEWEKFVSPHETQMILEKYGCSTVLVHGMFYNVLTNKWSWISDTSINYALHALKQQKDPGVLI